MSLNSTNRASTILGQTVAILLALAASCHASEVLDPPEIDGWRYSHRAYHAVAGAIIDVVTIEAARTIAPQWAHRHPVGTLVLAGFVAGTAGLAKELADHRRGPESWSHSDGDIAVTTAGGVIAGLGFSYTFRF